MNSLAINLISGAITLGVIAPTPGDLERTPDTSGQYVIERWAPGTTLIPWDITYTENGSGDQFWTGLGTNGPSINGFSSGLPLSQIPGISALIEASQVWSYPLVPDSVDANGEPASTTSQGATTIKFSKNPTLVEATSANFPTITLPKYSYLHLNLPPGTCCRGLYKEENGTLSATDTLANETVTGGTFAPRNTVDFITRGKYWETGLGMGRTALAVARVWITPDGVIEEFDIGFNRVDTVWRTEGKGCSNPPHGTIQCWKKQAAKNYAWLTEDEDMGVVLGPTGGTIDVDISPQSTETIDWPVTGFADVQGAVTHEFGHALGLAHTYQCGRSNLGASKWDDPADIPTMWPYAQVSGIADTYEYPKPGFQDPGETIPGPWGSAVYGLQGTWPSSANTDESIPVMGGLLGYSARSLELDDLSAIGRGYPSPDFTSLVGSITGTVTRAGSGYQGAMITAISMDHPNRIRASTLSYDNGSYALSGLPEGDYILRVEPFPRGIETDAFILPEYIGFGPANSEDFPAEYWNAGDAESEYHSLGDIITITNPGGSAVANFTVDVGTPTTWNSPTLTVTDVSDSTGSLAPFAGSLSNRRLMPVSGAYGLSGITPEVEIRIDVPPGYENATAYFYASDQLDVDVRFGHVSTIVNDPALILAPTGTASMNGSSTWTGTVNLNSSVVEDRHNIQLEAVLVATGQPILLTNSVGVWFQ